MKRLAVLVEDHPLDYGSFEGTIPQGEYGGGTVMLWDHGHWEPLGDPAKGWKKGRLHFRLHGTKLRGSWSLIRLKDEPNWLLFKETDEYADAEVDITEEDRSVTTRSSMEEIALHLEVDAPEREMPSDFKPQLATLVKEAPRGDSWVHEIKYDGYRFLTFVDRGEVRLITRGGLDWTSKFPSLCKALRALPVQQAILDGEVVVLDERGVSSFQNLQNYRVSSSEKTDEGILRHPSFQGLEKSRPSVKFRLTHPERVIDASTGITKGAAGRLL